MRAVKFGIGIPQFLWTASLSRRVSRLFRPCRGARIPQRLGAGIQVLGWAAAQPARNDDLRGGVHRAAAAGLRRVRVHPAQPGAPGQEPGHAGPAQPGQDRGAWAPAAGAAVRRLRRGPQRYVARFTEGIALMKALWTEPRVNFDGEFWQLRDAAMEPKPFQKLFPRCGSAGTVRSRCGARCGSATASSVPGPRPPRSSPTRFCSAAGACRAGRPADGFPVAKRLYVAIDADA